MVSTPRRVSALVFFFAISAVLVGLIPMTLEDFHVPGTQVGDAHTGQIWDSDSCMNRHGSQDAGDPYETWRGSLMALGGRDPLFYAQVTTDNRSMATVSTRAHIHRVEVEFIRRGRCGHGWSIWRRWWTCRLTC